MMPLTRAHYSAVLCRCFATKVSVKHVKLTTSRSSGPGGQSVNKSETKVQARFNVPKAIWLSEETREKFIVVHKNRISQAGDFVVESDEHSSQLQNRKACLEKINRAIEEAEKYKPQEKLTFLEHIQRTKAPEEIRMYNQKRREERRKQKRIGHKTLSDF